MKELNFTDGIRNSFNSTCFSDKQDTQFDGSGTGILSGISELERNSISELERTRIFGRSKSVERNKDLKKNNYPEPNNSFLNY